MWWLKGIQVIDPVARINVDIVCFCKPHVGTFSFVWTFYSYIVFCLIFIFYQICLGLGTKNLCQVEEKIMFWLTIHSFVAKTELQKTKKNNSTSQISKYLNIWFRHLLYRQGGCRMTWCMQLSPPPPPLLFKKKAGSYICNLMHINHINLTCQGLRDTIMTCWVCLPTMPCRKTRPWLANIPLLFVMSS